MQFYIVHKDPRASAKTLPLYALRTNMREGRQILSDIGHRFGVTFDNRCRPYNLVHPWTRTFSHKAGFNRLMDNLEACCEEHHRSTGKTYCWNGWVADFMELHKAGEVYRSLPEDQEAEVIHYLITAKASKMTDEEIKRLKREEE